MALIGFISVLVLLWIVAQPDEEVA
jgi:hypothetical protein